MKRGLPLFLLVAMLGLVGFSAGCHDHDDDDHDTIKAKVDTKGSDKGIEIKKD